MNKNFENKTIYINKFVYDLTNDELEKILNIL